jgi:hypothetical protein
MCRFGRCRSPHREAGVMMHSGRGEMCSLTNSYSCTTAWTVGDRSLPASSHATTVLRARATVLKHPANWWHHCTLIAPLVRSKGTWAQLCLAQGQAAVTAEPGLARRRDAVGGPSAAVMWARRPMGKSVSKLCQNPAMMRASEQCCPLAVPLYEVCISAVVRLALHACTHELHQIHP